MGIFQDDDRAADSLGCHPELDLEKDRVVVGPAPPLTAVEAKSLQQLKAKVRDPHTALKATPRQREIIGLAALGMTDKEIAARLGG